MNIFNSLRHYATPWTLKEDATRSFDQEEIDAVTTAVVVASEYGNSVCFHLTSGGQCFIPLSRDATVGVGETVDMTKAKLITLVREGDEPIQRVFI